MSGGSSFQSRGAATLNARSPNLSLVRGTKRSPLEAVTGPSSCRKIGGHYRPIHRLSSVWGRKKAKKIDGNCN